MTIIEIWPTIARDERGAGSITTALASYTLVDVLAAWVQLVSLLG